MVGTYNEWSVQLDALKRLEEKDGSGLHIVYSLIVSGDGSLVGKSGQAIREFLEEFPMKKMIRLSENFRQYTSMEWDIDWKTFRVKDRKNWFATERDYISVLILGSFHPNGYYREQCTLEMAQYPDTLPYLILRMNDWVEQVRVRAARLVRGKAAGCDTKELFMAAPALEKVKGSGRRDVQDLSAVETVMWSRMEKELAVLPIETILNYEFDIRKSVYRRLFSRKIIELEQADRILCREKSSFCQSFIMTGILKYYDCSMEQIDAYLCHKNCCVRRKALEYKYAVLKDTWPEAARHLLDKNHGIRELAVYIARRHSDIDLQDFYHNHLSDEDPAPAILGLSETGTGKAAKWLLPFLGDYRQRVVRCSITAIGRLGGDAYSELFWNYLTDQRLSVAKAAYRSVTNNQIRYGAKRLYQAAAQCEEEHGKRYLTHLLFQEKLWQRLPCLLEWYRYESSPEWKDLLLSGMWGQDTYAKITKSQGKRIEEALEAVEDQLPEKMKAEIRFELKFVVQK